MTVASNAVISLFVVVIQINLAVLQLVIPFFITFLRGYFFSPDFKSCNGFGWCISLTAPQQMGVCSQIAKDMLGCMIQVMLMLWIEATLLLF